MNKRPREDQEKVNYGLETIWCPCHYPAMTWAVVLHDDFLPEFRVLPDTVQDELLARAKALEAFGPQLGRPNVDTLKGSSFGNLKELRFKKDGGVWRFAFAFDPRRNAIILCGGDKQGEDSGSFYRELIAKAEARFAAHIAALKKQVGRK